MAHSSRLFNAKLRQAAGDAKLTIIKQNWGKASWWDKFVLGVDVQSTLQREILMSAWQEPCWYARTIIPEQTHHAHSLFFNRLEHESLAILFLVTRGLNDIQ